MMGKLFPLNCADCQHMQVLDMSIYKITCRCNAMNVQVDMCGSWVQGYKCPLDDEGSDDNENV